MFGDVWDWAGLFRKTNKNIGVDKYQIEEQLVMLLADCRYWINHHIYEDDELAIREKYLQAIYQADRGNMESLLRFARS